MASTGAGRAVYGFDTTGDITGGDVSQHRVMVGRRYRSYLCDALGVENGMS
jgi:hypothetical protein